jgi:hypothetical protein
MDRWRRRQNTLIFDAQSVCATSSMPMSSTMPVCRLFFVLLLRPRHGRKRTWKMSQRFPNRAEKKADTKYTVFLCPKRNGCEGETRSACFRSKLDNCSIDCTKLPWPSSASATTMTRTLPADSNKLVNCSDHVCFVFSYLQRQINLIPGIYDSD